MAAFSNRRGRYADEPALPLLLRRGAENHVPSANQLWMTVGVEPGEIYAGKGLATVAAKCGAHSELFEWNSARFGEKGQIAMFGELWNRKSIQRSHRQWCPDCIREHAYHRSLWDVVALQHCVRHSRALQKECPRCKSRVHWHMRRPDRCICGEDLSGFPRETIDPDLMRFDAWIENRILSRIPQFTCLPDSSAGRVYYPPVPAAEDVSLLAPMSTQTAITVVERLGAYALAPHLPFASTRKAMPIREVHSTGIAFAARGENAIWEVMDRLLAARNDRANRLSRGNLNGPQWGLLEAYGTFCNWLTSMRHMKGCELLIKVAIDHAEQHVDLKRNATVFGSSVEQRNLTFAQAAEKCGVSATRIQALARDAGFTKGVRKGRPVLLDPSVVEDWRQRFQDSVDLNGAATLLGVGTTTVLDLSAAGHFHAFMKGGGETGIYCFERTLLGAFLARFAPLKRDLPAADLVALPQGSPKAYLAISDAVGGVLAGNIILRALDHSAVGLQQLLVSRSDLRLFQMGEPDRLTVNQIAVRLGTKWETVRDLLRLGKLRSERTNKGTFVDSEEVERFARTYVKGSEAAAMIGTHWKWAPAKLGQLGIEPVITRDECRSMFFLRADVERANRVASDRK